MHLSAPRNNVASCSKTTIDQPNLIFIEDGCQQKHHRQLIYSDFHLYYHFKISAQSLLRCEKIYKQLAMEKKTILSSEQT